MRHAALILILCSMFFGYGLAFGYFEISNDVPTVFDRSGENEWRMWAGADMADDDSTVIMFDDALSSVLVGTWTDGYDWQTSITAIGYEATNPIYDTFITAVGRRAAQWSAGNELVAMGWIAGWKSVGDDVTAIGTMAGSYNTGNYNTAVGWGAFDTWTDNAGLAGTVTDVDEANNQMTIGAGHGWGAAGTYVLLDASTTDTLPAGLSSSPEVWVVVNATVVECKSDSFTDDGVGTHTLTPKVTYSNSTALGCNAEPTASNQVVLGDTNVTEVKTSGAINAHGRIVATVRTTGPNYSPLATDDDIFVDTDGGAVTVDLPAGVNGRTYRIINCGSSANDVTISPNLGDTVRGGASGTLTDGQIMTLTYETTEKWW